MNGKIIIVAIIAVLFAGVGISVFGKKIK